MLKMWREIAKIEQLMNKGNYLLALETALSLLPYLPKDVRKEFQHKTDKVSKELLRKFIRDFASELEDKGYVQ